MTCCRSTRFASSSAYRRQMGARCCGPACSRSAGTWRPSKRGYTATAAKRCRHSGRSMNRMRVTCSRLIPDMLTVRVAITFAFMLLATGVRGAPADTGPADGARRAADRAKGGTACELYRRYVAYLRCLDFHRFLNAGQRLRDAVRLGEAREPDGSYDGDGIPRTAGGHPYEPLEWGEVRRSGTD